MHTLFNTIYKLAPIYVYMYMNYYIAKGWEVVEAVLGISPT